MFEEYTYFNDRKCILALIHPGNVFPMMFLIMLFNSITKTYYTTYDTLFVLIEAGQSLTFLIKFTRASFWFEIRLIEKLNKNTNTSRLTYTIRHTHLYKSIFVLATLKRMQNIIHYGKIMSQM